MFGGVYIIRIEWCDEESQGQRFRLETNNDFKGFYWIASAVDDGDVYNNYVNESRLAPINRRPLTGFRLIPAQFNWVVIHSHETGDVLDWEGGAEVFNGLSKQVFTITPVPGAADGTYTIHTMLFDDVYTGFCIYISYNPEQRWFVPGSCSIWGDVALLRQVRIEPVVFDDGTLYRIVAGTGECLAIDAQGTVVGRTCDGSDEQLWSIEGLAMW